MKSFKHERYAIVDAEIEVIPPKEERDHEGKVRVRLTNRASLQLGVSLSFGLGANKQTVSVQPCDVDHIELQFTGTDEYGFVQTLVAVLADELGVKPKPLAEVLEEQRKAEAEIDALADTMPDEFFK